MPKDKFSVITDPAGRQYVVKNEELIENNNIFNPTTYSAFMPAYPGELVDKTVSECFLSKNLENAYLVEDFQKNLLN